MALHGLVFHFHDIHGAEKSSLSKLITSNGGKVSFIFGKSVSHLVTTNQAIHENGYKLQRCKKNNIKPITEKWIQSKISKYVPPKVAQKEIQEDITLSQSSDSSLTLSFSAPPQEILPPTVSMVLPDTGVNSGGFTVSITY